MGRHHRHHHHGSSSSSDSDSDGDERVSRKMRKIDEARRARNREYKRLSRARIKAKEAERELERCRDFVIIIVNITGTNKSKYRKVFSAHLSSDTWKELVCDTCRLPSAPFLYKECTPTDLLIVLREILFQKDEDYPIILQTTTLHGELCYGLRTFSATFPTQPVNGNGGGDGDSSCVPLNPTRTYNNRLEEHRRTLAKVGSCMSLFLKEDPSHTRALFSGLLVEACYYSDIKWGTFQMGPLKDAAYAMINDMRAQEIETIEGRVSFIQNTINSIHH
jgi:hypothetical protein